MEYVFLNNIRPHQKYYYYYRCGRRVGILVGDSILADYFAQGFCARVCGRVQFF